MSCNILTHKESMLNARQTLVNAGVIDESDRVQIPSRFIGVTEALTNNAKFSYGVDKGPLFSLLDDGYSYESNLEAFAAIDQVRKNLGIYDSKESIGYFRQKNNGQTDENLVNQETIDKLNSFELYSDVEKVCGNGICNYTATQSTNRLYEAGLNPFPQSMGGSSISVMVPGPLSDFHIQHYVSAVAINNSIYIYDMPQHEFISDDFFGAGSNVTIKRPYKPRLIPLTIDEVKAAYNLTDADAGKFISSVLYDSHSAKFSWKKPGEHHFIDYIKESIQDADTYINSLEEEIKSSGYVKEEYKDYYQFLRDLEAKKKSDKLAQSITQEEEDKVLNFLKNKLRLRVRDYIPSKTNVFSLTKLIESVIGKTSRFNKDTSSFDNLLKSFNDYVNTEAFLEDMWGNYNSSLNKVEASSKSLETIFSTSRLLQGFLKRANTLGFDKALSEYSKSQQYSIRSLLLPNIKEKYKSEKQMIYMTQRYFSNLDNLTKALNINFGRSIDELILQRAKDKKVLEKSNTILNYLKATDGDVQYLSDRISAEANRRLKYFVEQGNDSSNYLQLNRQSTEAASEDVDSKVAKFLASIGVNISKVDNLTNRLGNPITGIAKADMLNKVIQVVQGKADITTLPEEAAHFFVELLGDNNPMLEQMIKDVTQYKLYADVAAEYKNNPLYRNEDGTINFPKLKKEAVGKLIAYHIVAKETGSEYPEKIAKLEKWWEKLWNYVTNIFKDVTTNPFEQSASQILSADTKGLKKIEDLNSTEEFLQINNTFNKIRTDQQRIHLDNSIDPSTGQKKHVYTVDGKPVVDKYGNPRSVTSVEVDKWYRERFPNDNRTERQKNIDTLKAEEGDKIHKDVESIIERFVDSATGELRAVPLPAGSISTNQAVYDKLYNYVAQVISSYEPGTKFMTEVRLYDTKKNLSGSIDLLILKKDGSADVFDWKSQEVTKGQTDLKWFKEPAYRIQLDAYRRILMQEYGITKFGKVRAIPIATSFAYIKQNGQFNPTHVNNVEIGSVDPRSIPEEKSYLLPVVSQDESTGDKELDKLIAQLNGIYEVVSQKNFGNDRNLKAEELNKIKRAIRDLQVRQDLSSFVENGKAEVKKYYDKLQNNSITSTDILESKNILSVYAEAATLLEEQLKRLNQLVASGKDDKGELKKLQDDFLKMTGRAQSLMYRLDKKMMELGNEIAEKQGITGLLLSEKTMDRMKVLFRSLSTLPTRALRTFYKLLSTAQAERDFKIDELNTELGTLKTSLEKWAATKGISNNNMFDSILKFDEKGNWTGEFLDKYSKEFYTKRNEAIKAGNLKWIMENSTFDDKKYEASLASYKKMLDTVVYSTDPQKNQERKDKALEKWIEARDVRKSDFAKINKKNYFLKPNSSWESVKWKELNLADNKPLKDVYEYFQKMKSQSDELGMIEFDSGFVPSVRQDKLELAVFNGLSNVFTSKGLFENLQTDSDKFFGEIDPTTGELVKKIPVAFINDLGIQKSDGTVDYSMKSKDLFKVFSIWGAHTYNYAAMQSIKDSADLLVEVERSKKSLVTNLMGKVTKDKKEKVGNEGNADVLEDFVKYYVYGQTSGDNSDYSVKIGDKEYSAVKTGRAVLQFMSLKTLGLNVLSGTATFVGGTGNAFFQASKGQVFNNSDWANGLRDFTTRDTKLMGALGFFDVGLEDMKKENSNKLSVNDVVKHMTLDQLFIIQRNGDKAVQYPILGALLHTHMIENGKIVDINKFVKEKYNYNNFYNLSPAEQKEVKAKIDKEVAELKKTKSLSVVAEIKDGQYSLPGVDRHDQTVIDFRNKVRKVNKSIIGNSTHDDINLIRTTMLGQVLMQFRSWMPQMVTERFGDMSYDADLDSYQYGKARLFLKHMHTKKILPLIGELITGFGTNTIDRAKQRYNEFKIRQLEQGEEFNMTEAEFIDMYLGNLRSSLRELMVVAGFIALVFWVKPGDDDDDKTGVRKYIARAMTKYQNEFSFYYSPSEFTKMLKNPVPIVGLFQDFEKFVTNSVGQIYGFALSDDQILDDNHPMKYLGKMLPITKEAIQMYAIFDDDFRKDWDIRN